MADTPRIPVSWRTFLVAEWRGANVVVLEGRHSTDDAWDEIHSLAVPEGERGGAPEAQDAANGLWTRACADAEEEGGVREYRLAVQSSKGEWKYMARAGRVDFGGPVARHVAGDSEAMAMMKSATAMLRQSSVALKERDDSMRAQSSVVVELCSKMGTMFSAVADIIAKHGAVEAATIEARATVDREATQANTRIALAQIQAETATMRASKASAVAEKHLPTVLPAVMTWLASSAAQASASSETATVRGWMLLGAALQSRLPEIAAAMLTGKRGEEQWQVARGALHLPGPVWAVDGDADSPNLAPEVLAWARWALAKAPKV